MSRKIGSRAKIKAARRRKKPSTSKDGQKGKGAKRTTPRDFS
jgi:hypothetical protein